MALVARGFVTPTRIASNDEKKARYSPPFTAVRKVSSSALRCQYAPIAQ